MGHAGDQLSVGAIEAHTARHVAQALAYGFGHAVEHLKFIAFFGNVQLPDVYKRQPLAQGVSAVWKNFFIN